MNAAAGTAAGAGQNAAAMGSQAAAGVKDMETLNRMRADGTLSEEEYNRLRDQMRAA
jgi:hypothetical protein